MTARDFIDRLVGVICRIMGTVRPSALAVRQLVLGGSYAASLADAHRFVLLARRAGSTWADGYSITSSARAEMDFGVAERYCADDRGFPCRAEPGQQQSWRDL